MKKVFLIVAVALMLTGCSYIEAKAGFDLPDVSVEGIVTFLGPQILTILGLILADFILGVAVAFKIGVFDWTQLSDFLRNNIIPKLLGWIAAEIIIRTVAAEYLSPPFDVLGPSMAMIAFLAVIGALSGSIIGHFKSLGIFGSE